MKKIGKKLVAELMKDSKRSDRELAKVLGVSQPTITRSRRRLVEEGVIEGFTAIPDFAKLGYEIMAVTVGNYIEMSTRTPQLLEKGRKWMGRYPNIIFASRAEGMGKDAMMISLHKSYSDYMKFMKDMRLNFGEFMKNTESLIICMKEPMAKPLTFRGLGQDIEG